MANVARPRVTVLMPVFNGAAYLPDTIRAIQAQTFADFELLCVDDHSPDDSAAIIRRAAASDPRIRYLKTVANQGIVPKVLNFAAPHVRGSHWVYTSQDDRFSSDWLEKMVEALDREKADVAVTDLEQLDANGEVWGTITNHWRAPVSGEEAFLLSLDWTIPTNALWPTAFLTGLGYETFGTYADEYSGRKFFLAARKVAFASGVFGYFHGNPDAITKQVSPRLLDAPYNEFRIWKLVDDSGLSEQWRRDYAYRAWVSLCEAEARLAKFPALRAARARLEPALEGLQTPAYRAALRDYCGSHGLRYRAMTALIDRPAVRSLYARYLNAGRWGKARLRGLGVVR